jgi:low affinity Fe/Cu permease
MPDATNQTASGGDRFRRFAHWVALVVGSSRAFLIALSMIAIWALTGPIFGFSDTWQLVINTGTTVVTFLMVFLIQSTQNRDAHAIHLKLDELIRATRHAHNDLIGLEHLSDDELNRLYAKFANAHAKRFAHRPALPIIPAPVSLPPRSPASLPASSSKAPQ